MGKNQDQVDMMHVRMKRLWKRLALKRNPRHMHMILERRSPRTMTVQSNSQNEKLELKLHSHTCFCIMDDSKSLWRKIIRGFTCKISSLVCNACTSIQDVHNTCIYDCGIFFYHQRSCFVCEMRYSLTFGYQKGSRQGLLLQNQYCGSSLEYWY